MKVYLGCAIWRTEEAAFSNSMRLLWAELIARKISFQDGSVVGDALVSRARSMVASSFLRSDCDVMLSVDSDIWFRAADAIKLCEEAMEKDLVGGLYMTRKLETQPAMMLPDQAVMFQADQGPVETEYLSGGFIAVHRRVLERLAQDLPKCHETWAINGQDSSFWPFYMPYCMEWPGEGHIYLSEDWAFCQRAKDAGYTLWLDPSIRLGHIGSYMYTLEDLIRPPKPEPQPLRLCREADGKLITDSFDPRLWKSVLQGR